MVHGNSQTNEEGTEAIKAALSLGYRHIDTASAYANEQAAGKAFAELKENRENYFISGKLWNTRRSYSKAIKAFQSTLRALQLDYLDLYLIHWPATSCEFENWREINRDTWLAFEELYASGVVKALGVCNCLPIHLESIMEKARIFPMVNQIEYHPGLSQAETVEFCRNNNILVEAWSPLGNGRMLENPELQLIAKKYDKTTAQFCLRWCLQNGVLPLTKSINPERIEANSAIFDFVITAADMTYINTLPYCGGSGFCPDKINVFN